VHSLPSSTVERESKLRDEAIEREGKLRDELVKAQMEAKMGKLKRHK